MAGVFRIVPNACAAQNRKYAERRPQYPNDPLSLPPFSKMHDHSRAGYFSQTGY